VIAGRAAAAAGAD